MNIVVVNDGIGVNVYKKWSEVERHHGQINKDDFVKEGEDYILIFDRESYQVTKDVKLLESIAVEKVFGKKKIDFTSIFLLVVTNIIALAVLL
ncbi:hypothetical protein [Lysinibacillus xylanilyticus]|uniref:Uncharacterized protein n=1 Tax=Lysinibacillus xylanilyticus TaxID=582475 RepID=A0A2M9PY55_9BACI|nr:hypothetical protein [Lysinibacillus xylanilyticus]PJO40622.1 hypothetical protein CWD94_27125 [Lysinibacillus xylanilyticus]